MSGKTGERKTSSSFNKHPVSAVEAVLSEPDVELKLLNKICFSSGIEGQGNRSLAWKLMLGYLPPSKDTWQEKVRIYIQ